MSANALVFSKRDAFEDVLDAVRTAVSDEIDSQVASRRAIRAERTQLFVSSCISRYGHNFKTSCGETACTHCGRIAWR